MPEEITYATFDSINFSIIEVDRVCDRWQARAGEETSEISNIDYCLDWSNAQLAYRILEVSHRRILEEDEYHPFAGLAACYRDGLFWVAQAHDTIIRVDKHEDPYFALRDYCARLHVRGEELRDKGIISPHLVVAPMIETRLERAELGDHIRRLFPPGTKRRSKNAIHQMQQVCRNLGISKQLIYLIIEGQSWPTLGADDF